MTQSMIVLFRAWGILIALSLAALPLADGEHGPAFGIAVAAALLSIAVAKGRQILLHYMELHRARRCWRTGLTAYLLVVGLLILAIHAAGALGWHPA
ncbi:cytochrome C oxidase subunit IV family protein [Azospirillum soli]|uniref:cytochrome C oxidase subunit IV family protein n=1 Tax=Azospirillum soli TaxID=1304799 RepID=UPI001AE2BB32|nr:cytochrome C oxidase subunit IV family protein [Azospirillum soli]MBP2316340.1 hypothetical protein [Azospirillum soli]